MNDFREEAWFKLKPHFLMLISADVCQKGDLASLPVILFIAAAETRPLKAKCTCLEKPK